MGGLDIAGEHFPLIALVHAIDEGSVPGDLYVEMRPEGAVDERVYDVAEADKEAEVKRGRQ